MRILILEDDPQLSTLVGVYLAQHFRVEWLQKYFDWDTSLLIDKY